MTVLLTLSCSTAEASLEAVEGIARLLLLVRVAACGAIMHMLLDVFQEIGNKAS